MTLLPAELRMHIICVMQGVCSLELVRLGTGLAGLAPLQHLAACGLTRLVLSVAEEVARAQDRLATPSGPGSAVPHDEHVADHEETEPSGPWASDVPLQQPDAQPEELHEHEERGRDEQHKQLPGPLGSGRSFDGAAEGAYGCNLGSQAGSPSSSQEVHAPAADCLAGGPAGPAHHSALGTASATTASSRSHALLVPPQLYSMTSTFCCKLVARAACLLQAGRMQASCQEPLRMPASKGVCSMEPSVLQSLPPHSPHRGTASGRPVQLVCSDVSVAEAEQLNEWMEAADWAVRVSHEA